MLIAWKQSVAEIPSEEVIIEEGKKLIESATEWKAGNKYFNSVQTTYRAKEPGDGAPWYCRISEHTPKEATFDAFWEKLSKNKAVNEKECVSYERHLSCLLIWVNMQVHSWNQKGNQSQGDFTQRIYLDDVLYIYSSRIASRLHRASSDTFV